MNSYTGPLPRHLYVYVDTKFTHKEPKGFIPAVWFGLASWPGRAWGCSVVLECGACYRNLPPNAIAFSDTPEAELWSVDKAQRWDCYGWKWTSNLYPYLNEQRVTAKVAKDLNCDGTYLFSVSPLDDGFSYEPSQNKEFTFIELDNGRLTIQPTDYVLFNDSSFTDGTWPSGLKRQVDSYSSEMDRK
jgi:hypothetical protein